MLSRFIVHLMAHATSLVLSLTRGVSKETVHILAVSSWHLHLDIFTKIKAQGNSLSFEVLFYINLAPWFMRD